MRLEVVVLPVADVDRAKDFYGQQLGSRLDTDFLFDNGFRVVQFTPHGSGGSIQFGRSMTSATPRSAQGLHLIVSDIQEARDDLAAHGAEVGELSHAGTPGAQFQPDGTSGRVDAAETAFASTAELAGAMRRASAAHGEHGKRIGAADQDWPDWYSAYMVAEQARTALPI